MKNYNEYINDSVFKVNLKYNEMQNKTKELFFRCLDEERSLEYFKAELKKLWGTLDHSFLQEELEEFEAMIHEKNMAKFEIKETTPKKAKKSNMFFTLVAFSVISKVENKFIKQVQKDYKRTKNSVAYRTEKQEYLKLKVNRYDDAKIVPYYVKSTGQIRYVPMNVYSSMIHNTNMTYTAWNTTLNDAEYMGYDTFYIDYHPFSCEYCVAHQERKLTAKDVMGLIGTVGTKKGEILHPNCKCILDIYDLSTHKKSPLTDKQKSNIYHIRQKTNTLTLEKSRIATDMKIQKRLGNMDEYDKLNQRRNKINSTIRDLKKELPTKSLKKQVTAIKR